MKSVKSRELEFQVAQEAGEEKETARLPMK